MISKEHWDSIKHNPPNSAAWIYSIDLETSFEVDRLTACSQLNAIPRETLDKMIAEIEEHVKYNDMMGYRGIEGGLLLSLNIINKYCHNGELK